MFRKFVMQLKKRPCDKHGQSIFLDFIRTYAVIAYLFTFQPFSTVLCSQNALISVKCVSPVYFTSKLMPAFCRRLINTCPIASAGVTIPKCAGKASLSNNKHKALSASILAVSS